LNNFKEEILMATIGTRRKTYTDVVTIPATKTASATTISSSEMYPFESSAFGGANVIITADDLSKVGDTIAVRTYVSFDAGDTWILVNNDSATTLANGSGAVIDRNNIPLAPRLRVDVVFDSAATLSAGHGIKIDVDFYEMEPESKRIESDYDAIAVGDTKPGGDSALAWYKAGDTITVSDGTKVFVMAHAADKSKVVDTFTYVWQSSTDASHWWTGDTLTSIGPANGSGIALASKTITTGLSEYGRVYVSSGDTTAELNTGHGVRFFVISME
jgi:hypothetical protein